MPKKYHKHEIVNGKIYKPSKLKKHKEDKRDFRYHKLMGFSLADLFGNKYTPKKDFHVIKTLSVKDQHSQNTCTQESATVQKEVAEDMVLSEQSLTCLAKEAGVITSNGLSDLRSIQKVIQSVGIAKKELLNGADDNWDKYSSPDNLTKEVRDDAVFHKSQSFFSCTTKDEVLAALDDNKVLHIGGDWYAGFNMSNGFSYPWIVGKNLGPVVGGHATAKKGYCFKYKGIGADKKVLRGEGGTDVYIVQNSYSEAWGATFIDDDGVEHKGCFFMPMDWFQKYWGIAYAQVDIAVDTASFLNQHQYAFVRDADHTKKAFYMIWGDKKNPFPDMLTFLSYTLSKQVEILDVPSDILNAIPNGDMMDITGSDGWALMNETIKPDNLKKAQEYSKINS